MDVNVNKLEVLSGIIKRLSKIKCGNQDLDSILSAFICGGVVQIKPDGLQWFYNGTVYPYTTSIDTAMLLIPDGWTYMFKWSSEINMACVVLYKDGQERVWVDSATLPLGICLAALHAWELHIKDE